jgi:hypothetical protein
MIPAWSLSADLKSVKVILAGRSPFNPSYNFSQLSGQPLKIHLQ